MPRPRREGGPSDLAATRTERTLRDVLHELPVDALVPDGWLVGTEVVKFGDRLPADGITLRHGDYPRELLITTADKRQEAEATPDVLVADALVVFERDRVMGRRTAVASVGASDDDAAELAAALAAAARAAARIERGRPGEATVERSEPSASLSLTGTARGIARRLNLY